MAGAKRQVPFLALAAALLLAGCGGGGGGSSTAPATTAAATTTGAAAAQALGKAAYVAQMRAIGRSLSASLTALGKATTAANAATALKQVQDDLRAAAEKLAAITPPARVAALHARLVRAVREFADELSSVIAQLQAGKLSALSAVPTLKGLAEIQAASAAIQGRGYKIGG